MRRLGLVTCLVLASCGGKTAASGVGSGGPTPPAVNGTVGGQAPAVTDSLAIVLNKGGLAGVGIAVTSVPNTCALIQADSLKANMRILSLLILAAPNTMQPATGTYSVSLGTPSNGPAAQVDYLQYDADCSSRDHNSANAGSVTLSTISTSDIGGSFDVTFGNGDHLSGSFDAPICNYDANISRPSTTCVP